MLRACGGGDEPVPPHLDKGGLVDSKIFKIKEWDRRKSSTNWELCGQFFYQMAYYLTHQHAI